MELIDRTICFSLSVIDEKEAEIVESLQTSAATSHIKNLQMISLNRAFLAMGMFSMFEALIQDRLKCTSGFTEVRKLLSSSGEDSLQENFELFYLAINVLKHGHGRSYSSLLEATGTLPFRIKERDDGFFDEGDIAEITSLVEVDSQFVRNSAQIIQEVSRHIEKAHSIVL